MVSEQESIFGLTAVCCATGIYLAVALVRAEARRLREPTEAEKPYASNERFLRRLVGSLIIGAQMVMILFGVYAIDFSGRPVLAILYWGSFCALMLIMMFIGVVDWLDTRRIAHMEHSRALKRLIEEARRAEAHKAGDQPHGQ